MSIRTSLRQITSCKSSSLACDTVGEPRKLNANTNFVRVLFIVSVLAAAWALVTLIRRDSTKRSAHFVSFIDLCFVGALIGGVYELKGIDNANCVTVTGGVNVGGSAPGQFDINYTPFDITAYKTCALLKASFALAIINIILFFSTFILAYMMYRRESVVVKETYTSSRRRSHDSR